MGSTEIDAAALEAFAARVVSDAGAAMGVLLAHLGDRLGLYRAMGDSEPVTAEELARRTGTNERMVEEWLANQAAGGYVTYDAGTSTFTLPPEQAFALADESSPMLMQGLFDMVVAVHRSVDRELGAFRTGGGLAWGDHHDDLFEATERSFRPAYRRHLAQEWVPAVEGMHERLTEGAAVADVGCGRGASTVMLAAAYPRSTFVGYDYHPPSVEAARGAAARAGVADRVTFEVADAAGIEGEFDLVCFLDCWHDTADPLGAASAARRCVGEGGAVLLVEPFAEDGLEANLANPMSRLAYGASALVCTPCSLSGGGPGLGAQAGERAAREVFEQAGFSSFRRMLQTPMNIAYEARP